MHFHWIRFVNIAKYRDLRVDFEGKGLMALLGTNGIGKTHLLQGPALLLWGKKAKGKKTYTLYDVMTWGTNDCLVEGEFTHMGVRYYAWRKARVSRTARKTRTSTASIFQVTGEKHELLAGDSTTDFDEKVKAKFGSLDVFLACVLAAQKGAGDLMEADRAERYEIFAQMTGASGLLAVGVLAKDKAKEIWTEVLRCGGSAALLRQQAGDLESLERELGELKEWLDKSESELLEARAQTLQIEGAGAELSGKVKQYEAAATRLADLIPLEQAGIAQLALLQQELTQATSARESLPELERRLRALRQAEQELDRLQEADKAWSLLAAKRDQQAEKVRTLEGEVQGENVRLAGDDAYVQGMEGQLLAMNQARSAWEAASAAESARQAQWQAVSGELQSLQNELTLLTNQSALAASAPQPAGLCRSCPLVGHALAAQDQLPQVRQRGGLAQQRLAAVQHPIQLPFYNQAEHEKLQHTRTMLGDIDGRKAALGRRKRELSELRYDLEELNERLERMNYDPRQRLAAARTALDYKDAPTGLALADAAAKTALPLANRIRLLKEQNDKLSGEIASLRRCYGELAATPPALQTELDKLRHDYTAAKQRAELLETGRGQSQGNLGAKQTLLDKGRKMVLEAENYEAQRDQWSARHNRLERLRQIFSKSGVLPLIIRQAAPEIERVASQMLEVVWNSLGRLRIITDDGTGKEIVDLYVEDERGLHPVELYSGGEETILRVIMRLAIGRYRAQRTGQRFDMIGFDEAFESLAPENIGKVISLLNGMREFVSQVMVISHTDDTVLEIEDKLLLTQEGGEVSATWRN